MWRMDDLSGQKRICVIRDVCGHHRLGFPRGSGLLCCWAAGLWESEKMKKALGAEPINQVKWLLEPRSNYLTREVGTLPIELLKSIS